MEYLGLGKRLHGQFLCSYSTKLVQELVNCWPKTRGTLQTFFEGYLDEVVPYSRADGDVAVAVRAPLEELARRGIIELYPLQDSPTQPYFGNQRYRGIRRSS
jgi:hypothetical protein